LPNLPSATWEEFVSSPPSASPHLLLVAAAPCSGALALEHWLGMLDTALPWARKVGGLTAGEGSHRLFLGAEAARDGGVVGLALRGVDMEAHSFQGAVPVGPSFEITACDGNIVHAVDGRPVGEALGDAVEAMLDGRSAAATLMCGISVPTRAAARSASLCDSGLEYVVRPVLGFSRAHSVLALGASADLVEAPSARLQLHRFSAEDARAEMRVRTALLASGAVGDAVGGLMVSCLGRGEALYGEADVESEALRETYGSLALAGLFAGGEIGPVGARTFVHTYTTTVGLLRTTRRLEG